MISTLGVIIIAVGASVSFFIAAAVSIVLILRAKDKQRRNKDETVRQLSDGQRRRLSVGGSNYAHVPEPRTNLRKSLHLPHGLGSESWAAIPSQEDLVQCQRARVNVRPDAAGDLLHQKRRRSLRSSFSGHSLSLPKTRRQKKIEKAVPLRAMPNSPLSAITEQSGTNTNEASPSIGVAELPTQITPKATPDKNEDALPVERRRSADWPLTSTKEASWTARPTIIPVPTSRHSTPMRVGSTGHSIPVVQTSLSQRSISVISGLSMAPEGPLPPLPLITPNQWPIGPKSRPRLSAASVETIGSSVLGGVTSPSQTDTDLTSLGLASPSTDINPTGLPGQDEEDQGYDLPTAITTGSPKGRHTTRYRSGQPGYSSARASIKNHSSFQNTAQEQLAGWGLRPLSMNPSTTDPTGGKLNLSSRPNSVRSSVRSSVSPSITDPFARTGIGTGCKSSTVSARHSMYEPHSVMAKLIMDPAVFNDVRRSQTSSNSCPASSRPASIANDHSLHWEKNSLQTIMSSSLKASPRSQCKGHKRQNCVRISNIPVMDTDRRASRLPQMTEEEEESLRETGPSKPKTVSGLNLLERQTQGKDLTSRQEHVVVSPFHSQPISEPTSWKRPGYCRAPSSFQMMSCKRDSEVFGNSCYDPSAPNIFSQNQTPRRQGALSTPPHHAQPHSLVPLLRASQDSGHPDSPTLPTPAISSTALFVRAVPTASRISGVQGPRKFPLPGRSSHSPSPSPIRARTGAKREDLRRSVMTLKRMDSDSQDKTMMSQIYRDISDGSSSSLQGIDRQGGPGSSGQLCMSGVSVSTLGRSSTVADIRAQMPVTKKRQVSVSPSVASIVTTSDFRFSKSQSRVVPSPSTMSAGATSIWEDVSVGGDSPETDLPTSFKLCSPQQIDVEAYENFVGREKGGQKDRERESRLTSPQGRGLGLMGVQIEGKVWGTPGSLYDRDGFLKD